MTESNSNEQFIPFANFLFARKGLAESTVGNYVSTIRRLTPILGERPEHAAIDALVAGMRRAGASYSHIKNTSQALEAYTEFLGNPIKLGRPQKPKRLIKNTLSEAEVTLLIAAARDLRDRAILSLLAYSGLRNAELCSLTIADVDVAGQLVHVNGGKGEKDRTACVAGACVETLAAYLRERSGMPADCLSPGATGTRSRPRISANW